MPVEVKLRNSSKIAIVDEFDYESVKSRTWFLDYNHAYTKIMVQIENPKPRHTSYPLKIRMDRYIFGLTTHNFVRIRHMGNDRLNNTRWTMFREPSVKAKNTKGMTRYLGVTTKTGYIVATYKDKKRHILYQQFYDAPRNADQQIVLPIEKLAAEQYDKWARAEEGWDAKTNFLPASIYVK